MDAPAERSQTQNLLNCKSLFFPASSPASLQLGWEAWQPSLCFRQLQSCLSRCLIPGAALGGSYRSAGLMGRDRTHWDSTQSMSETGRWCRLFLEAAMMAAALQLLMECASLRPRDLVILGKQL